MSATLEETEGLSGDPARDPATRLLLDAPLPRGKSLLLIEGGCGRLAAHFAPLFDQVLNQNIFHGNHQAALAKLGEAPSSGVRCFLGDLPGVGRTGEWKPESCDEIIFRLARGTALVNAAACESFRLLRKGGSLWVSGHNQDGIKSFAKRAENHFGNAELLKIKSSCRLLRFQKITDAPVKPIEDPRYFDFVDLELRLAGAKTVRYATKPGIFSYRSTDIGTALLARHLPDCTGKDVLDLGCGSGVLSLAAFELGAKSVLAMDVNAVAVACAARNFALKSVPGIARCANLAEGVLEEFDWIISNPPFHRGGKTDYGFPAKILATIAPRLREGGSALLVANRFLDYSTPAKGLFISAEVLAQEQGYRVYRFLK